MLSLKKILFTLFVFNSYSLTLKAEQQGIGDRVFSIALAHQRGGSIIGFTEQGHAVIEWDLPKYGVGILERSMISPHVQIGAHAKVKYSYNRFLNTIYSHGYDIIHILIRLNHRLHFI